MKKLNINMSIIFWVGILIFGCSNQSPMSVNSNNSTSKSAALSDGTALDISTYNNTQYWIVTLNQKNTRGDYYLAKYNTSTGQWDQTTHYGTKVATASSGGCYHINTYGQIWEGFVDGSSTQIGNPPGILTFSDIGCGRYGSNDYIWIIGSTGSQTQIWKYRPQYPTDSLRWIEATNGRSPIRIAVDPFNGNAAAIIQSDAVYTTANELFYWSKHQGFPTGKIPQDVGICGSHLVLVVLDPNDPSNRSIWTGWGSTAFTWQAYAGWTECCGDADRYWFVNPPNLHPTYNMW